VKRAVVIALACLLARHSAPAQSYVHIEPPRKGDGIQLGYWTLPKETLQDGRELTDPLTEIIRIKGKAAHGTGFFLENCRVMTALHVLIGLKRESQDFTSIDSQHLNPGESLIGETFEFETQPIPWRGGRKVSERSSTS
jgi:hypothetical protein